MNVPSCEDWFQSRVEMHNVVGNFSVDEETAKSHADVTPLRFVVQRHRARTLHYDFRLEIDGVYRSWALPKGLPDQVGEKRLAINVEDHALSFGEFEGVIPEGQYGAGTIQIWDTGDYVLEAATDEQLTFALRGSRYSGHFVLFRFARAGEHAWLLLKKG